MSNKQRRTRASVNRRISTETKASFKTSELIAYLAAVVAVVITALVVGGEGQGGDRFSAVEALRLITFLTIGYMVTRGLAKSGSRDFYDDDDYDGT